MEPLEKRFPHYHKLLHLYPVSYRRKYGGQMLQTLADMLDDPERSRSAVWLRLVADFPLSVARQQYIYSGEIMTHATPPYIKRNAIFGAWLVAPFFVFIILNGLLHNRLQHSWVWHTEALYFWLIVLPGLAALFNLLALLRWIHTRRQVTHGSAWKSLIDIRHNWPALAMVVIGIGILCIVFFHDSVHCVTGNPIRELHNPHLTWRCIQEG